MKVNFYCNYVFNKLNQKKFMIIKNRILNTISIRIIFFEEILFEMKLLI